MITIVSGFQRCGSSLMLQMLSAGGLPVFSDADSGYPVFETMLQFERADDPTWLDPLDGHALKWLEPQRAMPPTIRHELRIIWMRRDADEQARSAVKFLSIVGGVVLPPNTRRAFAASYRRDTARAIAAWEGRGAVHVQHFEHLIENPQAVTREVCAFLDRPLDQAAMVGEVRERPTACLPYLLEAQLIRRRA